MDMSMIDLSELPNVGVGDEVEIFGPDNPVETLAQLAGTIPYELTCAVSKRVPRVYFKNGREIDRELPLIVAVQPTRGLDVGAIEYIHSQLVSERDKGKAVLLVSLELDEVMSLSDRILVMYEGKIVGEFDPKKITVQELGLYMAGAKRAEKEGEAI